MKAGNEGAALLAFVTKTTHLEIVCERCGRINVELPRFVSRLLYARKMARLGWRVIDGKPVCPACAHAAELAAGKRT